MSTGFNEENPNVRDFKHYSNPNNNFNFNTANKMIPMHQVQEIQASLQCYNKRRGCKFLAKHHWCLCCMMLKALGSEFFEYEILLKLQDPDFVFSMTDWQRDEYMDKRNYWLKWCDSYPRGATL